METAESFRPLSGRSTSAGATTMGVLTDALPPLSPPVHSGHNGLVAVECKPGVDYNPRTRVFTLRARSSMYVFRVDDKRQLEHLYWGEAVPEEDDLSYLSMGNAITMFDPVGELSVAKMLGLDELSGIGDVEDLSNRWKVYTKQKNDVEAGSRPRRLENASWRLWTMERSRGGDLNRDLGEEALTAALGEEGALQSPEFHGQTPEMRSPTAGNAAMPAPHGAVSPQTLPIPHARSAAVLRNNHPPEGSALAGMGSPPGLRSIHPSMAQFQHQEDSADHKTYWGKLDPSSAGKNTKLFEFSDRGTGDYRDPSMSVVYDDGTTVAPMEYRSHKIIKGKPLMPLFQPSVYSESNDEATTLRLELLDPLTKLTVYLYYTVMHEYDIITRRTEVKNTTSNSSNVWLNALMSCTVDFDADRYYMTQLAGGWARERQVMTKPLSDGITLFRSSRGASSHQFNPFMAISVGSPATETRGTVYGFNLVYSGNFQAVAEVTESRRMRVNMGLNSEGFTWLLKNEERFCSPEVVMCYSSEGMGGMSREFHRLYRNRLIPRGWRDRPTPVLLNTWESNYFNVSHEVVLEIAHCCVRAGIELLCLDDGWFGHRHDPNTSLGDWVPNEDKFPFGLEATVKEVRKLGLEFGIWVEPEMVSEESDLYRAHPDWCLHVAARARTKGRNQLVLDFSRQDVRDHIYNALHTLLSSAEISYCKWDFNRHLTEVFSTYWSAEHQGEIAHRFVLGVYEVFGRITAAFPEVLFESCSGGGGRFDPGMLYFTPQIWTSDNTDALSRVYIQYGTSMAYPVRTMGSHVSTVPNHQTMRSTSMKTRSIVALNGTYGYELDPRSWTEEEILEIRGYIALHKEFAPIIWTGDLYRLWNPFEMDSGAWMYVSGDKKEAVVMAVNLRREVGRLEPRLKLQGLDPATLYSVDERCPGTLVRNDGTGAIELDKNGVYQYGSIRLELSGKTLVRAGLPVKFLFDADSVIFHLSATRT